MVRSFSLSTLPARPSERRSLRPGADLQCARRWTAWKGAQKEALFKPGSGKPGQTDRKEWISQPKGQKLRGTLAPPPSPDGPESRPGAPAGRRPDIGSARESRAGRGVG